MEPTSLLTPANSVVAFIDHQPQMLFGVASMDRGLLMNNAVGLAKSAKLFGVPTVLTSVETKAFSGNTLPALADIFSGEPNYERSSMNSWEDDKFRDAVRATGRKRLVIAALWTEVCGLFPALSALEEGFETYIVTDASGGITSEAHERAIARMIQHGVKPITWIQYLLELQRDWSRREKYDGVMEIVKEHGGTYGAGVEYAYTMVHGAPASTKLAHATV